MGKGGVKEKPPAVSKDANHILTNKASTRTTGGCMPSVREHSLYLCDWRYKYRTNSKNNDHIRDTFFPPRAAAPVMRRRHQAGRLPLCCFIRGLYVDEARRGQNDLYRGGVGRAVRRLRAEGVQCAPAVVG